MWQEMGTVLVGGGLTIAGGIASEFFANRRAKQTAQRESLKQAEEHAHQTRDSTRDSIQRSVRDFIVIADEWIDSAQEIFTIVVRLEAAKERLSYLESKDLVGDEYDGECTPERPSLSAYLSGGPGYSPYDETYEHEQEMAEIAPRLKLAKVECEIVAPAAARHAVEFFNIVTETAYRLPGIDWEREPESRHTVLRIDALTAVRDRIIEATQDALDPR